MKRKISILLSLSLILTLTLSSVAYADYDPKPTNIVKLSATSKTVEVGNKFELYAFTSPYDCEDNYLVWNTSNNKVVAFEDYDRTGDEMDFVAKKAGTATITCIISGTNIKKTCKITVTSAGKARIKVDDKHMSIDVGEWEDIDAKLIGGKYKNRKLTYKVANKKIAKVKRGRVYGKKAGHTKITIRSKANKKIKKVVYVYVEHDY